MPTVRPQAHRQREFTLSTDPLFTEKVRDIVGLYLYPPDKALTLGVDEKSQIQTLDLANGTVLTECKPRHRHQEFLQFLRHIEANVPADLDIHLVIDNYATHKHDKVRLWLAQRPRFHVHYTPTYSSWLNQVEIWFNPITQQAICRGSLTSTKQLVHKIEQFVADYNPKARPFAWVATADSFFDRLQRLFQNISGI